MYFVASYKKIKRRQFWLVRAQGTKLNNNIDSLQNLNFTVTELEMIESKLS
jgi:hypothetical protein